MHKGPQTAHRCQEEQKDPLCPASLASALALIFPVVLN